MQLIMVAKITFAAMRQRPEIVIRKVTSVHIESTWKDLTSTCDITLPRNVKDFDKYNVNAIFQGGDPVTVELGYDNNYVTEFTGYIASVSAGIPIVIKCEDEMYKLKRMPVNFSAASITLEKLLKTIAPGYSVDALENVPLGGVRLSKTTVAKVLEKLEQKFKLHSFMRGKQLVCGKYYSQDTGTPPLKFNLEKNTVSNDLTYRSKDSVVVLINGTSILANGKKIKCQFGVEGGDRLDLAYYNIQTLAELQRLVKQDYDKRIRDGFDGSFTAFGIPSVRHGLKVDVTSNIYPDRNGVYYVDGVTKDYTDDATYRQTIKIGDNAA